MNTKLVAVQEAFQAMLAGKNILVRSTESSLLTDFRPVSEFAADIWAKVGFEFTIEIEKIEVAGISFTKPLTLADVVPDQDVYVIEPMTGMYWYKYNPTIQALNAAIERGFAQADTDNARLQLEAFSKLMGRECGEINILTVAHDEPKQRKTRKKKEDQELKDISKNEPVYTPNGQNSASNDVEKKTSTKSAFTIEDVQEIEVDSEKIVQDFTAKINAASSEDEALNLRYVFNANGHLTTEQTQALCRLVEEKCEALNPEKYAVDPVEVSSSIKSLYIEALTAASTIKEIKEIEAGIKTDTCLTDIHRNHLETYINLRSVVIKRDELIDRAINAATPVEANALVKYTTDWTEDQRKPLLDAINKRLVELDVQNKEIPPTPPSLMVQIENAPDLTTLDALEIDVSARHPDIQPKLMGYIRKRRAELEKMASFTPKSVIQSLNDAQSVDELNRIMSDPLLESIDQTEISEIYEQRFNELNG
ncbi:hypothetical protein [Acinetobacter sp. ANC 5502]